MISSLLLWRVRWFVHDARKKLYKNISWLFLIFAMTQVGDYNIWSERLSRIAGYSERNKSDLRLVLVLYLLNIGSAVLFENGIRGGEFRHFQESLPVRRRDAFITDMMTIALSSLPVILPFALIVPLFPYYFTPRNEHDVVNFVFTLGLIGVHFCWGQFAYLSRSITRYTLSAFSLALIFSEVENATIRTVVLICSASVFLSEVFYIKLASVDMAFGRFFHHRFTQGVSGMSLKFPISWVLVSGLLLRKAKISTLLRFLLTVFFTIMTFVAVENSTDRLQATRCYFFGVAFITYIWSRCFSFVEKAHLEAAPFLRSLPIDFDAFLRQEKQKIQLICMTMSVAYLLIPLCSRHFGLLFLIPAFFSPVPMIFLLSKVNLERKVTSTVLSFLLVCIWATLMSVATSL